MTRGMIVFCTSVHSSLVASLAGALLVHSGSVSGALLKLCWSVVGVLHWDILWWPELDLKTPGPGPKSPEVGSWCWPDWIWLLERPGWECPGLPLAPVLWECAWVSEEERGRKTEKERHRESKRQIERERKRAHLNDQSLTVSLTFKWPPLVSLTCSNSHSS